MKRAMERINLRRMAKISTVPAKLTSLSLKSQNKTKPSIITRKSENWKNFSRDENFYLKCALTVPPPTDASTIFSFVPATTPEATLVAKAATIVPVPLPTVEHTPEVFPMATPAPSMFLAPPSRMSKLDTMSTKPSDTRNDASLSTLAPSTFSSSLGILSEAVSMSINISEPDSMSVNISEPDSMPQSAVAPSKCLTSLGNISENVPIKIPSTLPTKIPKSETISQPEATPSNTPASLVLLASPSTFFLN